MTANHIRPTWFSALFLLVLFLGIIWGCSLPTSYRKAPEKAIQDVYLPGFFKKRVALLPFENRSLYRRANPRETFQASLIKSLRKECPDIELVTPTDQGFPAAFKRPQRYPTGAINNYTLSQTTRQEGFNAVIVGTLMGFAVRETKEGMWWFREDHAYLKTHFLLEIYDPHTTAKLFSEPILHEFEIDPAQGKSIKATKEIDLPQLDEIIRNLAENLGKKASLSLNTMLWTASVTEVEGEQIIIPFGKEANIREGDKLEAYDGSRTMHGVESEKFIVPGFKLGEIRITKVHPHHAEGGIISGKSIPVGSIVLQKP